MTQKGDGRESREQRARGGHSGTWASSSQDFARLANLLFAESARYARSTDGNCSIHALAGIPTLFSAMRCLLLELNAGLFSTSPPHRAILDELASAANDVQVVLKHYSLPSDLRRKLELLLQVRHEIVHPSHQPGPEPNNTPAYLTSLRDSGLLQSTGKATDYVWLAQLQSHRLFRWSFEVVSATVAVLVREHRVSQFAADGLRASYSEYLAIDAT